MYFDALRVKIHDEGVVRNKTVQLQLLGTLSTAQQAGVRRVDDGSSRCGVLESCRSLLVVEGAGAPVRAAEGAGVRPFGEQPLIGAAVVRQDFGVGQTRVIVEGDMRILPTYAADACLALPMNAMLNAEAMAPSVCPASSPDTISCRSQAGRRVFLWVFMRAPAAVSDGLGNLNGPVCGSGPLGDGVNQFATLWVCPCDGRLPSQGIIDRRSLRCSLDGP